MALGSQAAKTEAMSGLTGLTHDIFVGKVVNNVRRESKTAMLFQDASPGEYRLEGQNMKFATDLRFATGGMATSGKLPDHVGLDAVQGTLAPVRRYRRIALDNLVEKRASGPGAFDNLSDRLFDILWDSWKSMEIRHSVGSSTGYVAKCSSRTSSTVVVLKDGYGHAGTNPIANLSEGSIVSWYDVSAAGIAGAAKISSINYSTNTITLDSAATWEPSAQIAADDYILFATTPSITADYFESEKDLAPNGLGVIVDPDAVNTTVFGISQTTYPRWKPFRAASGTFDHVEVTEHWLKLGIKRGFDVTPDQDVALCHPALAAQLARTLLGYQQQINLGGELKGGYTSVTVGGMPLVQDGFMYHDVFMTINKPSLFRVNLGGDADFFEEDGSMWSRIADFDGKDAYVGDYVNFFSPNRGAHGAITAIATPDITDSDFDNVPNY